MDIDIVDNKRCRCCENRKQRHKMIKSPYRNMPRLHERANYVTSDGLVAMGAEPIPLTLDIINDYDLVIDLRDTENGAYVGYKGIYRNFPIPNGGVPTEQQLNDIMDLIKSYHQNGKSVYIHCVGGHGRSGTIAAIYIGKLYRLNGTKAIEVIETLHNSRKDMGRKRAPAPETKSQVSFIMRHLGEGDYIPDRSDRSWLKPAKAVLKTEQEDEPEIGRAHV